MKYSVITSGGKQYKVTVGQVLEVDKIDAAAGSMYLFDKVLLTVDGDTVQVGTPYLANIAVGAKVIGEKKGDKVRVAKFKSKVRYRKVQGFRSRLTQLEITSLSEKNEKKTASKTKE
jgi:large subunit ribosomal protein L21